MNNPLLNTIKIIFPVGIIILLAGCKTISMKKADEAMQLKNYAISADMYDQLASNTKLTKDVRQTAAYRGAESYRYNHQPKKALKLYVKAKKYGAKDPMVTYRVAQMYKQLNQYEDAIENFKSYQKEMPSSLMF